MPLNTNTPARNDLYQNVQYLRKRILYTDSATTIKLGTIPAGSIILAPISGVDVQTVFNAGTNNRINIGITGSTAKYAANSSLATAGFVPMAVAVGHHVDVDTDIILTVDVTGTAATTGEARVFIAYITPNG